MRPVNGDAFRALCDHVFWCNETPAENPGFRHGQAVFCKIDEVWRLFRALRRTRCRIVLVSSEGDRPVTPELWEAKPPQVEAWFGTNMFARGEGARGLPLGLGNSTGRLTPSWQEIRAMLDGPTRPDRNRLLYANFGTRSNPAVREPLAAWIRSRAWITTESHGFEAGKAAYLRQLASHRFVLCPPGNGEDTHRLWESLYCDAIPIARRSPAMIHFRELPILFVDAFEQLTEEFLRNAHLAPPSLRQPTRMLDADFWGAEFASEKSTALGKGPLSPAAWLAGWAKELLRVSRSARR